MTGRLIGRFMNAARRVQSRITRRPLILLYHRIGEAPSDPWLLAVSSKNFEEHLDVLTRRANVIALADVDEKRRQPLRPVAITFDDCYDETLRIASALLEKHGAAATFFAPTDLLCCRREFWWDELERIVLDPVGAACTLELEIGGKYLRYELDAGSGCLTSWRAWEPPSTRRETAYADLYQRFLPLRAAEQDPLRTQIRRQTGAPDTPRESHLPTSAEALTKFARFEAVAVGAHTRSHPLLAALSPVEQQSEIEGSKRDLECLLGREVNSFAYPYGKTAHYSDETVDLVRQAGFLRACSNFTGLAAGGETSFELPRWTVPNCGGEEFDRLLSYAWSQ